MLHACAHNPTGVDPSSDQWKQVVEVCQRKKHLVILDSAYQGELLILIQAAILVHIFKC